MREQNKRGRETTTSHVGMIPTLLVTIQTDGAPHLSTLHDAVQVEIFSKREILLDAPIGSAKRMAHQDLHSNAIILTTNPCPEYLILLQRRFRGVALMQPWNCLPLQQHHSLLPLRHMQVMSPLSEMELLTLALLGEGHDSQAIARKRGISHGTVRNSLSEIYDKLSLKNRAQAHLYYWGIWHILRVGGWSPPLHLQELAEYYRSVLGSV